MALHMNISPHDLYCSGDGPQQSLGKGFSDHTEQYEAVKANKGKWHARNSNLALQLHFSRLSSST